MLLRQLYVVKKGGKTVTFRFLNQINVFNVAMFVLHWKYYGNVR